MTCVPVPFTKMHGCGNDYIYVNTLNYKVDDPGTLSSRWSAPHVGIGSDGLVLIGASEKGDFSMRIFNADGTEAMMCGNACRCVGKFVFEKGLTRKTTLQLETLSGIRELHLIVSDDGRVHTVSVDMGRPDVGEIGLPLPIAELPHLHLTGTVIHTGNPHLVVFVPDVSSIDLEVLGPLLEYYPTLHGRTNVEFVQVIDRSRLRMRVWERGSGVTRACGTGACACVAAAVVQGLTDRRVEVIMDGGSLNITWERNSAPMLMAGEAVSVFDGVISA